MRSWRAKSRWRSQARTLWQRYRDVAELGDEHEVYTRLKEFLESFRTQYQEVAAIGDNSETMDRLYGDCTEVLHSLLDYVHRELKLPAASDAPGGVPADPTDADAVRAAAEASRLSRKRVMELVPEALRAAELILRDKRYVQARWGGCLGKGEAPLPRPPRRPPCFHSMQRPPRQPRTPSTAPMPPPPARLRRSRTPPRRSAASSRCSSGCRRPSCAARAASRCSSSHASPAVRRQGARSVGCRASRA